MLFKILFMTSAPEATTYSENLPLRHLYPQASMQIKSPRLSLPLYFGLTLRRANYAKTFILPTV